MRGLLVAILVIAAIILAGGTVHGEVVQASPEFKDCQEAAQRSGAPLKEVYAAAVDAFRRER